MDVSAIFVNSRVITLTSPDDLCDVIIFNEPILFRKLNMRMEVCVDNYLYNQLVSYLS